MSGKGLMNELKYLKAEEQLILSTLEQLKEQLNRLKVEELSLKSIIREKQVQSIRRVSRNARMSMRPTTSQFNPEVFRGPGETLERLSQGGGTMLSEDVSESESD